MRLTAGNTPTGGHVRSPDRLRAYTEGLRLIPQQRFQTGTRACVGRGASEGRRAASDAVPQRVTPGAAERAQATVEHALGHAQH